MKCIDPLYDWVREHDDSTTTPGPSTQRLAVLRYLISNKENPSPALVKKCHALVVECLVKFSLGGHEDKSLVKVFPYGAGAAFQSRSFKVIPSTHFGITLTNMYPFVIADKPTWEAKLKEQNYPITRLWPYNTLCRFVHFVNTVLQHRHNPSTTLCRFTHFVKSVVQQRRLMFRNYEDNGGKYHAEEDSDEQTDVLEEGDEDEVFSQT